MTRLKRWICALVLALAPVLPLRAAHPGAVVLTNLWSIDIGTWSDTNPAIAPDGTIYFANFSHRLWAIRPDGTQRWIYTAGSEIRSSPAIGEDGTIYFGCRDRKLYAVDAAGHERWKFTTSGWVDASPALGRDGTIYF